MRVFSRPVPTSKTNLYTLLGAEICHASAIGLQAPEANTNTIFFGDHAAQTFELRPEANAMLPVTNTKDVYIKGTSGDNISVGLF